MYSSVIVGLLLFVAILLVNVPGASANTLSCAGNARSYGVVEGDTLSRIGSRYGISWSTLASYNHLANPNLIYTGQMICIPLQGVANKAPEGGVNKAPVQQQQQQATLYIAQQAALTNSGVIPTLISQTFGSSGSAALAVAKCESGLNPNAYNPSGASGLFQIMPSTWAGTSQAGQSPYNASANITAAHEIFVRDGYSWREWTCQP